MRTSTQQPIRTPTAEQIRDTLIRDLPTSGHTEDVLGDRDTAILHDVYYGAWTTPSNDEVGDATVAATVAFELDSTVRDAKIIVSSGNSALDTSVASVLKQVHNVPGLSAAVLSKKEGVTITFKVE